MRIGAIKVLVSNCTEGIYLRWWFNGWHYYNFTNGYEIEQKSESIDTQVSRVFSVISKIERPTKLKIEYSYKIRMEGISALNIGGFTGLLMAEKVMMYEPVGATAYNWREVDLTRGDHVIRDTGAPGFVFEFEITRKELAVYSSVLQKSQKLYIGDVLCDLDDDEMIPQNKQVNDVSELQDRQSDFTATFKIRKTREMRDLFELSGEVGINTTYPYRKKTCKLVQDGIEIITGGKIILDKVNDQYYYVVIYSGNSDFFSLIDGLKISDLSLPTTAHLWEFNTQAFSNLANLDYCYPLCEPSDDASIAMRPPYTVDRVEIWGGYIWCFVKLSVIIQAILTDAGYTATGDVFTDDKYIKLYMPITDLQLSNLNIKPLLYSLRAQNRKVMTSVINTLDCQQAFVTCPVGDLIFKTTGVYIVSYAGNYTFRVYLQAMRPYIVPTFVYLYNGAAQVAMFTDDGTILPIRAYERAYSTTYVAAAGDHLSIRVSYTGLAYYDIQVIGITNVAIGYGSIVVPENHFGGLTQTDIIKTMCNLYALVPETNSKERNINFWNYSVLFTNIPIARDWSSYLSEKEDEVEFKFGDYARKNYLRYKESDDVIKDTGTGILEIDDDNLPMQKDIVTLPLSTCDEVTLLGDVNVSRIAFNQYDAESDSYMEQKSIDSRLVYINFIQDPYTSPPYEKTFAIRDTELPGGAVSECITPRKASSIEIAFSTLITNYSALQNILYQTNIRKCKFNLPVYEVAGFSHDVPIYVSQYKAYFYVNKILNYIPGKLCEIELIKL